MYKMKLKNYIKKLEALENQGLGESECYYLDETGYLPVSFNPHSAIRTPEGEIVAVDVPPHPLDEKPERTNIVIVN